MPSLHTPDDGPPVLFLLHCLGGSAREWEGVASELGARAACRPLDLPGFGDAAARQGHGVSDMADSVVAAIRAASPRRWLLVGHSMGAKVALTVARRAEDGEAGLEGLAGLVLLAGSPPAPEPMAEERREAMLGWFRGSAAERRAQAEEFVDANAVRLDDATRERAVAEVLRADPVAWRDWLRSGSREDWSGGIGVLRCPALILAGGEDGELGEAAQRRLMAPHFRDPRIAVLDGVRHLLPLEAPDRVAERIAGMLEALPRSPPPGHPAGPFPSRSPEPAPSPLAASPSSSPTASPSSEPSSPAIPAAYAALLHGSHTAARLRDGLLERAAPDDPAYRPAALGVPALAALRALLDRVLPQPAEARIDLAARIDRALAAGEGDGWRYADLPPDPAAFRAALRTLDAAVPGGCFAALTARAQDDAVARLVEGSLGDENGGAGGPDADSPGTASPGADPVGMAEPARLDARRMTLWFGDLRSMALRLYVAHPATLARLGYSGVAAGGDGPALRGFERLGIGARDAWEPPAAETRA